MLNNVKQRLQNIPNVLYFAFFALAVLIVIFEPVASGGGQLWRELQTPAGDWQPALGARVTQAKCTRYFFLVSYCDIGYVDTHASNPGEHILQTFAATSHHGERVVLMRASANPELISTTLSLADLGHRKWFMLLWTLWGSLSIGFFIFVFLRLGKNGASSAPASPTPGIKSPKSRQPFEGFGRRRA